MSKVEFILKKIEIQENYTVCKVFIERNIRSIKALHFAKVLKAIRMLFDVFSRCNLVA